MIFPSLRRVAFAGSLVFTASAISAAAQTLVLNDANATTLRGGSYAATNFGSSDVLETRASSDPTYVRRALFKFDTDNTIAQGTPISKAILTVTVASGSNDETRTISAFQERSSYDEYSATWTYRNGSTPWGTAGGDLGARYATASVPGAGGTKVSFDVTALVNAIVRGDFGDSRYTRIVLIDEGGSDRLSYKQYYSDEASDSSARPTLTITMGSSSSTTTSSGSTSPTPTPTTSGGSTSTSGVKLRLLQWNTHHGGYGTDGVYDPNRLATWAASFQPDIVMFNEIEKYTGWGNQDQPEVYKNLLQQKTGKTWYYIFAQEFGQWSSNGKGNLILSTYPLTWVGRYELVHNYDRSIAAAMVTVNGRNITLILTHLDPYDQTLRLTQATEVTGWAAGQPQNRIITGDMNAWPDQTSIAQYDSLYNDSWAVAAANGTAYAFSGNNGETKSGRIDYIFYSKSASNLSVLSSQVYDTRDSNGVMPSDHRPVLTTFIVK
ncbi:MAG TPA: endonuclease/exonuclease/phosphatase family protein [Vicinamibacterales bacterium]|jgi:endonuclease/exonuclease/phosphatase family metal-dependent hydrolase|nr:endonuclease/exonuclease/phosphatase family protein [Vicinamibacterales bacterium]